MFSIPIKHPDFNIIYVIFKLLSYNFQDKNFKK